MPRSRRPLWRRDSNHQASGKPGAVQVANAVFTEPRIIGVSLQKTF